MGGIDPGAWADKLLVRGTTADNGTAAKTTRPNFAEWEVTIDRPRVPGMIQAHSEDTANNIEQRAHSVKWNGKN